MRYSTLLVFLVGIIFLVGCAKADIGKTEQNPEDAVSSYFKAWKNNDYQIMYNVISDGFKEIEPTASTLNAFKAYAESQNIENVNIISIKQTSSKGQISSVDYEVSFIVNGKEIPFKGEYTLKYKPNDNISGWKLIHPYGENIDTS